MPEEDLVELKFRLYDGSDIGPFRYSSAHTVAMLKDKIVAEWPKDKKVVPKAANDVKLISAGKFLENNKTVGQCRIPFGEIPGEVITMHVVVQPSLAKTKTGWGLAASGEDGLGRVSLRHQCKRTLSRVYPLSLIVHIGAEAFNKMMLRAEQLVCLEGFQA